MMKPSILIILLIIGTCLNYERPESSTKSNRVVVEDGDYGKELAAADNILRAALYDYHSAKLDWDSKLKNGTITVRVNAKNQFGGYTGFKTYTFRHGILQD